MFDPLLHILNLIDIIFFVDKIDVNLLYNSLLHKYISKYKLL